MADGIHIDGANVKGSNYIHRATVAVDGTIELDGGKGIYITVLDSREVVVQCTGDYIITSYGKSNVARPWADTKDVYYIYAINRGSKKFWTDVIKLVHAMESF